MKYKGIYKDSFGIEEVTIARDFNNISFKLGDFNFVGRHFDDFELEGYGNYTPELLERFTFKPIDIFQSHKKTYQLTNFILSFTIPVTILNLETKQSTKSNLLVKLDINSIDNRTKIFLKIIYYGQDYTGTSNHFKGAADQINKQMSGKLTIKNCFWCLYADYSVYEPRSAGSMLCFLKYKEQYLKVQSRDEYMELPDDVPLRQEIYSCDSFVPRKSGTGYRG